MNGHSTFVSDSNLFQLNYSELLSLSERQILEYVKETFQTKNLSRFYMSQILDTLGAVWFEQIWKSTWETIL